MVGGIGDSLVFVREDWLGYFRRIDIMRDVWVFLGGSWSLVVGWILME